MVGKSDRRWRSVGTGEKRKGARNKTIAGIVKASARRVQRPWRRYKNASKTRCPMPTGRPANGLPGCREHSAVLSAAGKKRSGAVAPEENIGAGTGIHIPRNTARSITKSSGLASEEPKKCRRKWAAMAIKFAKTAESGRADFDAVIS